MPETTPAPADRVAAAKLAAITAEHEVSGAYRDDVDRLLNLARSVLELPAKWERFSTGHDAQAECAGELRRVITRELLTEEERHGRD